MKEDTVLRTMHSCVAYPSALTENQNDPSLKVERFDDDFNSSVLSVCPLDGMPSTHPDGLQMNAGLGNKGPALLDSQCGTSHSETI